MLPGTQRNQAEASTCLLVEHESLCLLRMCSRTTLNRLTKNCRHQSPNMQPHLEVEGLGEKEMIKNPPPRHTEAHDTGSHPCPYNPPHKRKGRGLTATGGISLPKQPPCSCQAPFRKPLPLFWGRRVLVPTLRPALLQGLGGAGAKLRLDSQQQRERGSPVRTQSWSSPPGGKGNHI